MTLSCYYIKNMKFSIVVAVDVVVDIVIAVVVFVLYVHWHSQIIQTKNINKTCTKHSDECLFYCTCKIISTFFPECLFESEDEHDYKCVVMKKENVAYF